MKFFTKNTGLLSTFRGKKIVITVLPLILLFLLKPLFSEEYYDFSKAYIPPSKEYEKKRSICFFNFRNSSNDLNFEYLSNGLPSVISSTLRNLKYTYDSEPLPNKIRHEYGVNTIQYNARVTEKDPRFISLQIEIIKENKAYFREESHRLGKEKDCFYIVTGEFQVTGSDSLKIVVEVTERKNGSFQLYNYHTSIKRAFQEILEKSSDIRTSSFLTGSVFVNIETGIEKNAFIYLDDELLGKSPLQNFPILPGKHKILIIKEGFQRIEKQILISNIDDNFFNFKLNQKIPISTISVTTDPEEADIFWGNKLIGKSPIKDFEVNIGQNRLRISKEGFIDKYIGIEVTDSRPISISTKLSKGDSDSFYKYNNNVFLDYTNFDFGNFSLYGSLAFYSLYMYNGYRESAELDRLNGRAIFNSLNFYQGLSRAVSNPSLNGNLFLSSLFYQQTLVDEAWSSTQRYRDIQNLSIGGVVSMLVFSGYFFSKGLNSENFEIGFVPSKDRLIGSEANLKIKINF